MATQQELLDSALAHMKKATISADEWCLRIQNGYKDEPYNYKKTENYYAQKDMEAAKTAPNPSPGPGPADAQARMFLAGNPLDCLQAGVHMIPVLTADYGNYQSSEQPLSDAEIEDWLEDVVEELRKRFLSVECWCDCRVSGGTPYSKALEMNESFDLDGAWGQCETAVEFDEGYEHGARRMVGQLAGLREDQQVRIGGGDEDVHLAFELYRNVMPWQQPDYGGREAGVGGNCIGIYASSTEGAVYTPVSDYIDFGFYSPGRDSVYGVGLKAEDWQAL